MFAKPYLLIIVCTMIFDNFIASITNSGASPMEHLTHYCTAQNCVVVHNGNLASSPRTASVVAEFGTPSTNLQNFNKVFSRESALGSPYLTVIYQYWSHQNISLHLMSTSIAYYVCTCSETISAKSPNIAICKKN